MRRCHLGLIVLATFGTTVSSVQSAVNPVTLPYGAESRVSAYASLRVGKALHITPSVGVAGEVARRTSTLETAGSKWDWSGSWRMALSLGVGSRPGCRLEAAYWRSWQAAAYLPMERGERSAAWAF